MPFCSSGWLTKWVVLQLGTREGLKHVVGKFKCVILKHVLVFIIVNISLQLSTGEYHRTSLMMTSYDVIWLQWGPMSWYSTLDIPYLLLWGVNCLFLRNIDHIRCCETREKLLESSLCFPFVMFIVSHCVFWGATWTHSPLDCLFVCVEILIYQHILLLSST